MRSLSILAAMLLSSGCAQLGIVQDRAAGAADGALEASVYGTCVATSVGALIRKYGSDPDGRAAWELFCAHEWARGAGSISLPDTGVQP